MRHKIIVTCLLVSSFTYLLFTALTPIRVLQVRVADSHALLFCSTLSRGDEILYESINSIYLASAQERWRVQEDGSLWVTEIVSVPAVFEYYGIANYALLPDGQYRGAPQDARYREIRMKVGPRGKQRLIVSGNQVLLFELVPEATTLIIDVVNQPRMVACLWTKSD